MHSFNAHNVQKPIGIDKLAAQFQCCYMRFDGSFSNSWRCEVSQQTGETSQITASEASVVATRWTVENTWIP